MSLKNQWGKAETKMDIKNYLDRNKEKHKIPKSINNNKGRSKREFCSEKLEKTQINIQT